MSDRRLSFLEVSARCCHRKSERSRNPHLRLPYAIHGFQSPSIDNDSWNDVMKTVLRRIQGLTLENLVRFGRRMLRNEQHETIYRIAAAEAIELPVFDDFGRDRWEDLL